MVVITRKQSFYSKYEIRTHESKYLLKSGEFCEFSETVDELTIRLKFNKYRLNVSNSSDAIILVENNNITNLLKIKGLKCDLDIHHVKSFNSYLGSAITITAYSFLLILLLVFPILYFITVL